MSICKFFKRKKRVKKELPLFNNYIWWTPEGRVVGSSLSEYREEKGKKVLIPDINLERMAKQRVKDCMKIGKLDGHKGFRKEADKLKELGFSALVENLSFGYKCGDIVDRWKDSHGHNRSMLLDRLYYGVSFKRFEDRNYCCLILSR